MFGRIKSFIKKHSKDIIAVFILMAISTLCVLPIAFGMVDGHDTDFHLASIYSLATSPKLNLFDVKIFFKTIETVLHPSRVYKNHD